MTDPDRLRADKERAERDRLNHRLSFIAFILMALVGLLSIIFMWPVPAQEQAIAEFTRSL